MKGVFIQVLVTLIISLGNFFMSFSIAWPSYALGVLESDLSPIGYKITTNEGNLIGSLPMLGSFIATPFSGWMADAIGRKKSEILIALCFVLSWSILVTAKSIIFIFISRLLMGLASGAHLVLSIPLVSEIGSDSTKGPLMSILIFVYTLGTLVSYIVGWLMSYQAVNYLALSISVTYVVLLSFIKETPGYLISKKNCKEALKSLKFYRGVSKASRDVLDEFDYLRSQINSDGIADDNEKSIHDSEKDKLRQEELNSENLSPWKILCTSKSTQRALVISLVNVLLVAFGGTMAVTAYAGQLFAIGAPGLSSNMCSIILSIAFVLGSLLATVMNGIMGRRTLQMFTAVLSSVILSVLSSMLRLLWAPEWMIPATVLAFCCFYQMGVANVPFVQLGEIFLPKVKSLTTVIVTTVLSIGNFIILASFTPMVVYLGLDGTFFFFSMVCALTAVIAYFTMRETKGVPVEKIQKMFENGYRYKKCVR